MWCDVWCYGTVYAGTFDKNKGAGVMIILSASIKFMGKSLRFGIWFAWPSMVWRKGLAWRPCFLFVVYVCLSRCVWNLADLDVLTDLQQMTGRGSWEDKDFWIQLMLRSKIKWQNLSCRCWGQRSKKKLGYGRRLKTSQIRTFTLPQRCWLWQIVIWLRKRRHGFVQTVLADGACSGGKETVTDSQKSNSGATVWGPGLYSCMDTGGSVWGVAVEKLPIEYETKLCPHNRQ